MAPHQIADVLMPLALDTAYSYAVPPGLLLRDGDVVQVPLGTRETIGVVWSLREGSSSRVRSRKGVTTSTTTSTTWKSTRASCTVSCRCR